MNNDTKDVYYRKKLHKVAPELLDAAKRALFLLETIEKDIGYCTYVTQKDLTRLIEKAEGKRYEHKR